MVEGGDALYGSSNRGAQAPGDRGLTTAALQAVAELCVFCSCVCMYLCM